MLFRKSLVLISIVDTSHYSTCIDVFTATLLDTPIADKSAALKYTRKMVPNTRQVSSCLALALSINPLIKPSTPFNFAFLPLFLLPRNS